MTRGWWAVGVLLVAGAFAMGCGSRSSTSPTTAPRAFTGSALTWLSSVARPWNVALNDDQAEVVQASRASGTTDASTFFSHLASACTRLLDDAGKARMVPSAPSSVLASDWRAMAAETVAYASSCLTLARTHGNADLTRWNNSLKAMDSANAALNTEVAAVRGTGRSAAG